MVVIPGLIRPLAAVGLASFELLRLRVLHPN